MSATVKHTAADKKIGMTVDELDAFHHQVMTTMSMAPLLPSNYRLKATVGFRGQLTSIEAVEHG